MLKNKVFVELQHKLAEQNTTLLDILMLAAKSRRHCMWSSTHDAAIYVMKQGLTSSILTKHRSAVVVPLWVHRLWQLVFLTSFSSCDQDFAEILSFLLKQYPQLAQEGLQREDLDKCMLLFCLSGLNIWWKYNCEIGVSPNDEPIFDEVVQAIKKET